MRVAQTFLGLALLAMVAGSLAQSDAGYPSKPIRMIVPSAPGSWSSRDDGVSG